MTSKTEHQLMIQATEFEVRPLTLQDRDALERLITDYRFSVTTQYRDVTRGTMARYLAGQALREGTGSARSVTFGAWHDGLCGAATLEASLWESEIYQRRIARLPLALAIERPGQPAADAYGTLLHHVLAAAREAAYDHIISKVGADDTSRTHAFERAGFLIMDTTLETYWDFSRFRIEEVADGWILGEPARPGMHVTKPGVEFRPPVESDIPVLAALAGQAFSEAMPMHFGANPALPGEGTRRLYSEWTRNACLGTFADIVRVADDSTGPVGIVMLKRDRPLSEATGLQIGNYGPVVVSERMRGKGVFLGLNAASLHACAAAGLDIARARVHIINYRMQRSCLAQGCTLADAAHTFHANLNTR
jgi:hypothetical protein